MIDQSFLEKIEEMARTETLVYDGRSYSTKGILPVSDPTPKPLIINTLTGIVDYLKDNPDELISDEIIIHVAGPRAVNIHSKIILPWMVRHYFLSAVFNPPQIQYGVFLPLEQSIVSIQSLFVPDEVTDQILRVIGNLTDGKTTNFSDDGVTQQVTAKAGISKVENVAVPSPIELAPYRTFREVDQPSSRFILRIRAQNESHACALFEADGRGWELEAIKRIRDWLNVRVDKNITILA